MKEQVITFKTAKLAKEKGFNELVIHYYTPKGYCTESEGYRTERLVESNWNNGQGNYPTMPKDVSCSAPTQYLLQRWLREKHNIHMYIIADKPYSFSENKDLDVIWICSLYKPLLIEYGNLKQEYKTYEEALEAGLQAALELINN